MKKSFLIILSLLLMNTSYGNQSATPTPPAATPAPTTPPATTATHEAAHLDTSAMDEIEEFSNKTLNKKTDYPAVKRIVELLLVMDDRDPSRSGVMLLSYSYNQNKQMYDKAINEVSKSKSKEQKKQLQEIKTILKNYFEKGQDY
ncbi:hypothetical protein [Pseudobdellovibrio exovorus]|uniref:Uncharacterized protein n=1 Tax=Pseudobdellovibrio exovorus JSS TaxID=1184267 RepID=M4VCF2_9BACT|nr:hypothetical protein [Pseudobdellovibrio exovorus]AGH96160.1 hypothetical protein A11Q_1944 [Pseudobdellovibrio exovorus JSS]